LYARKRSANALTGHKRIVARRVGLDVTKYGFRIQEIDE
jgi:hypothetical protein